MTVPIRVVSLATSTDRRQQFAEQMTRIPVDWCFFDARTGLPDSLSYDPNKALWHRGRTLTQGELGCFASHYVLWQSLIDDPELEGLCILEDDVVLDGTFFSKVRDFPALFKGHDCVRFYAKQPVPMTILGAAGGRHIVRFHRPPYGTQGYFISRAGAAKFIASIKEVVRPVDDEMDRVWSNRVPSVGVFPFPLFELTLSSTIEDKRRALASLKGADRWRRLAFRVAEKLRRIAYRSGL
jgi:glycosyl transferase family 25